MSAVQRIVVVGGDSIAWLSAAALKRAFRFRELEVVVLDCGASRAAPLGHWTLPSLRGMHTLLGIKEAELVRQTGATFKLASEHSGWQGDAHSFMHAHGEIGSDLDGTPFYKFLSLQRLAGRDVPTEEYSLGATAARLSRFAQPMSRSALTSSFTYAFHLEEAAYCAFLRAHAQTLGVQRKEGTLADLSLAENGDIAALILADGERIDADYFLDCSGSQAVLMDRVATGSREDWTAWLPNDRMLSVAAPAIDNAPAMTRTIASAAGWRWRIPLANSSLAGYVYCSRFVSDEDAFNALKEAIGGHCGEPVVNQLSSGRRPKFWERNCIAIGDTTVGLEPLAGASLHLAQLGIVNLISLFPIGAQSTLEAIEYNRIMGEQADSLRDFTIAHYRAGPAREGEYWAVTRSAVLPDRLSERLDLFRANGRIVLLDNESFEDVDWAWLLLGTGCTPEAIELHTQANLQRVQLEQVAALRASIEGLASSMPRHMEYIRRI